MEVRVQCAPFDLGQELARFTDRQTGVGAVVSFTGLVRDLSSGDLTEMVIEHYPGMTEKALSGICAEAVTRWALADALVIHRFGGMKPGEMIMMVATASAHRTEAFNAAEFLMDYLKSRAPFWKKEMTKGGDAWVAAKTEDETALSRW